MNTDLHTLPWQAFLSGLQLPSFAKSEPNNANDPISLLLFCLFCKHLKSCKGFQAYHFWTNFHIKGNRVQQKLRFQQSSTGQVFAAMWVFIQETTYAPNDCPSLAAYRCCPYWLSAETTCTPNRVYPGRNHSVKIQYKSFSIIVKGKISHSISLKENISLRLANSKI